MTSKKLLQQTIVGLILILLFVPLFAQQGPVGTNEVIVENVSTGNGFFKTFVRTPFVLFCAVGTFLGVIFSGIFEFFYNIFCGFDCGYSNTLEIWNLGWNKILIGWYWRPGVWWHVLIAFIVWSPLLKRKRKNE